MPKYDTEHRDTPICPHCGTPDNRDVIFTAQNVVIKRDVEPAAKIECSNCKRTFLVRKYATFTYTTTKT